MPDGREKGNRERNVPYRRAKKQFEKRKLQNGQKPRDPDATGGDGVRGGERGSICKCWNKNDELGVDKT